MRVTDKPTLTIGVPAFNEQNNIGNLLTKLLQQKETLYTLAEIIVNSDGSSDKTAEIVKGFSDPRVRVIENSDRQGKIKRVNQIFSVAKGVIVSIIDADVLPTSDETFNNLIKPFLDDQDVVYVSGRPQPLPPKNFIQTATLVARSVWDKVRKELNEGNSVYTCHGTLYAFTSEFAKANPFPDSVWADIGFHYFVCKEKGLKYKSAPDAAAYFRMPATIKDYMHQISRYKREDSALFDYFGEKIKTDYLIPTEMLNKYKAQALIEYPIHSLTILGINFYAKHFYNRQDATAQWTVINSTKEAVSND